MSEYDYRSLDLQVKKYMDEIWEFSLYIHDNPELGYEEFKACEAQCNILKEMGFQVQKGVEELKTAYIATYGEGKPVIGIASEYDALEGLGHACGHNLICASSILTAIAVKNYLKDHEGTVKVIGTPAEEGGGGKIKLLNKGVFDDVEALFMMHPTSDKTRLAGECMSSSHYKLVFKGESAHAASHPDKGRNALSAAILFLNSIGLWRQHFTADMRISSIIEDGGIQTGMIPETATIIGDVRSFTLDKLNLLKKIIMDSAEGCSKSMDCSVDITINDGYLGRVPNKTLSDVCKDELKYLNEPLLEGMPPDFGGEDIGNVSYKVPICCPYVTIFPDYKISGHTDGFRELAKSDAGYRCIEVTSIAMSRSIVKLFESQTLLKDARIELENRLKKMNI